MMNERLGKNPKTRKRWTNFCTEPIECCWCATEQISPRVTLQIRSKWTTQHYKLDPADEASRGQRTKRFLQNIRWIHGPDVLWKTNLDWPLIHIKAHSLSEDDPEVKRITTMNVVIQGGTKPTDKLMSCFSSSTKLKVLVTWYLKLKEVFGT